MNGLPESSLLLHSMGQCLLVSGLGIASVGIGYAAAAGVVGRYRSRLHSGAEGPPGIAASAVPTDLVEVWCRAAGVAVVALAVAAGAPWVHAFVDDLVGRWDGPGDARPWHYGLLVLLAWIGFLPFSLFVWRLPRWTVGRSRLLPARRPAHAILRPLGGPNGRPTAGRLVGNPPYSDPVRRSCRRYASAVALGASVPIDDLEAAVNRWPPVEVLVLIPAAVALFLATTVSAWIVVGFIAIVAAWGWVVYTTAYRAAVAAPGTALADYLMLSQWAARTGGNDAGRLAETRLDRNPATLQDHEQLVGVLARATRIGPVPWSPHSVDASQVDVSTRLWTTDRRGQEREITVGFHLRRHQGSDWRITRITLDDFDGGSTAARAPWFAVASPWMPR